MTITSRIDHVTDIAADFLTPVCPVPPSIKVETSNRCKEIRAAHLKCLETGDATPLNGTMCQVCVAY